MQLRPAWPTRSRPPCRASRSLRRAAPTPGAHLDAMARRSHPWELTFSSGRAQQDDAPRTRAGEPANVGAAQTDLPQRVRCHSEAALGRYDAAMEAA
ncbi:MAG: class I fructose-bisphosphate aldolase [Dehalococcoidia bacterium]